MRITHIAAVAAVACASGGAGAAGAAWAAASPAAPVTLAAPGYSGVRPSAIQFSADGGDVVTGIHWSSWGSRAATGQGTVGWDDCTPDCAQGRTSYLPARITLTAPGAQGEWTAARETIAGRAATFSISGHWLQGAMP